jgi:diguanylate cyclase (GGDEF)-like protein/PAS domain S-box-containing protein
MTINILPNQIVMMLGAVFSLLVLLTGWPRRKAIGGSYFVAFSISVTWWLIAGTAESFVVDQNAKILWSQILYIGFTQAYPYLFLFVVSYIRQRKIPTSFILAIMVIPLITLILAWTNSYHGWLWSGYSRGSVENNVLIYRHGFWFWVHVVYLYSLLLVGLVYLLRSIIKAPPAFRQQLLIILAGIIVPIITGTMYVLGLEPVPGMDITPTGLVFTCMFLAWGLFRHQLLDLLPVARNTLVEQLQDGVIVLDPSGRIVDINQATQSFFGWDPKTIFGRDIAGVSPDLAEIYSEPDEKQKMEISFPDSKNTVLEAQISTLFGENHQDIGKLLVLRDVTSRKQAVTELQQQQEYLSFLHHITLDMLNRRNMDELFQLVVNYAVRLMDAPFVEVMLEKNGELVVQACTQNQDFLKGSRFGRMAAKLSWSAFDSQLPAVLDDYCAHPDFQIVYSELALQAVADFPILVRANCIGILALGRSQPGYLFNEIQIKNGMLFAQLVALALDNAKLFSAAEYEIVERKQVEAELRRAKETLDIAHNELEQSFARETHLAHIDELTAINNRRSLVELAEREFNLALRYRPPLSILMYDIDDFKYVNDTFGHAVGDQVLIRVTKTVCANLRSADIIGRYGGDEFVILLPQTSAQEAINLAERIHASLMSLQVETDTEPLKITLSLGIAQTIHPTVHARGQTDTLENLFLRADQAMYAAKKAGRNRTVIFQPDKTGTS